MLDHLILIPGRRSGARKVRFFTPARSLRILVAAPDAAARRAIVEALAERHAQAAVLEASDAEAATEALLLRHPDLVIVSLAPGDQGGFRVLLDARSMGISAVLRCGPIDELLRRRLDELGAVWLPLEAGSVALCDAAEQALEAQPISEHPASLSAPSRRASPPDPHLAAPPSRRPS